jgi:hypothetical protein
MSTSRDRKQTPALRLIDFSVESRWDLSYAEKHITLSRDWHDHVTKDAQMSQALCVSKYKATYNPCEPHGNQG